MENIILFAQVVATSMVLLAAIFFANKRLVMYYNDRPQLKFRRQLLQIGGVLLAILFIILFMPFGDVMRGQLLRLYGLIFSATIALSSTTLVGNIVAGFMLKMIGNCKPGSYITVGDYFGRISEMDLFHVEIQTEERDLTTLPNTYLAAHPVRVMRASGTLISVEVSLGYDISRHTIETLLIRAATESGLEKPYVQIRELGDFSVLYQVSGLLQEVNKLIDKRREMRARTMDVLHEEGIEIVSPNFMNTRVVQDGKLFIATVDPDELVDLQQNSADSIAFDKASRAESVSKLRESLEEAETRLRSCNEIISSPPNEAANEAAEAEKASLETKIERLRSLIDRKEAKILTEN